MKSAGMRINHLARSQNPAGTGTNLTMCRMWLSIRQAKIVDSDASLKADYS